MENLFKAIDRALAEKDRTIFLKWLEIEDLHKQIARLQEEKIELKELLAVEEAESAELKAEAEKLKKLKDW
jgi:hypothetical protein